jgi:hypothetical protein
MTTTIPYDSGATGVPANEWGRYAVTSNPTQAPQEVMISIIPLVTPQDGWNLAGWAALEIERDGVRNICELTPVGLAPSLSGISYYILNADGVLRSGGAISGFRAVRWNIHRWIGQCRVRVAFFRP